MVEALEVLKPMALMVQQILVEEEEELGIMADQITRLETVVQELL